MDSAFTVVVSSAVAYVLGAVPFAYLITKYLRGIDIRRVGTRNPGAYNVYKSVGKGPGLVVFGLDTAKGVLAMYVVWWLDAPDAAIYLAAVLVTVGHNWSVFLGFNGGKGAATVFGISLTMLPWLTLGILAFTVISVARTRLVAVSVTAGLILLNLLTILTSQPGGQIALCLALSFLVAVAHVSRSAPIAILLARQRRWLDIARIE